MASPTPPAFAQLTELGGADMLHALLDVSLTGFILFEPVYAPGSATEIVDLAYRHLNPAAQRMLALPECPPETFLTLYPHTIETGIFAFYCDAFRADGASRRYDVNYQHDGLDNYFHLAARRSGNLLVVSFTDTADHDRSAAEQALRESQARERAARTEAERQRQQLYAVFEQAPAMICVFDGPRHVFEFVNPPYQALVGDRPLVGRPIAEAMPELAGQPIFALLDNVYRTGETFHAAEMLVQLDHANTDPEALEKRYYNFIYRARRTPTGAIDGIFVFAYDVTPQVLARQQVQALNDELESRVQARTQEAQAAKAEAERQRNRLERFFMQAPAAICVHDGPALVFELVNPAYQRLFAGRALLGKPVLEALPEVAGLEAYHTTRRVYETGETFEAHGLRTPLLADDGTPEERFFDVIQQARRDEHGRIDGVLVFAFEVTAQVQAQQRADALQAETLAAAQHRAQEQETLYQIFDQTPAAITLLSGPEHRYIYLNAAARAITQGRQLLGRPVREALPEVEAGGFVALLDEVYRTGTTQQGYEMPLQLAQPNGQPPRQLYFNFTYQAYREDGEIVGISSFAYDVTEQVLARQAREQQQQQLQELFEQAPVAIAVFRGPQYVLEVVNPLIGRLLNRPVEALVGRPFFEALPELRTQGLQGLLDEVRRTGTAYVAQERPVQLAHHAPSQPGYYNFVYHPLRDADGQVTGVTMVATDVSEQVTARQRLEALQTELQLILANTPAFIFRTDAAGRLTYVNDALFEWSGLEAARLNRLDEVWHIVHPDDRPALQTSFEATVAAGQPWESPVYRIRRRDGQYRWSITRTQPYRSDDGQLVGHSGLNIDIHEQVETQRQLARANVDLDNFVYTASHDLKAPITNIEGLLHVLQDQLAALQPGPEVGAVLGMMQDSVDRFTRTLRQLGDVVRLQQAPSQPTADVDLAAVLDDVRLDLAPQIEHTGARLDLDVADCPTVAFSAQHLRSIVYNLLSNALKYRHPDRAPHVRLHCRPAGEYVVLDVHDNGLGLAPAQQTELFGMFRRLHTHVDGSGIGLFMVKRILDNAGGRVEVTSVPGEGSTFSVYFRRS